MNLWVATLLHWLPACLPVRRRKRNASYLFTWQERNGFLTASLLLVCTARRWHSTACPQPITPARSSKGFFFFLPWLHSPCSLLSSFFPLFISSPKCFIFLWSKFGLRSASQTCWVGEFAKLVSRLRISLLLLFLFGSVIMEQTNGYPVKLHIYDLSRGMARQLSPALLGMQLDGIWKRLLKHAVLEIMMSQRALIPHWHLSQAHCYFCPWEGVLLLRWRHQQLSTCWHCPRRAWLHRGSGLHGGARGDLHRVPELTGGELVQRRQIQPLRAQLQRIQQRGGSVSHGQKNPVIHHWPPIWYFVHAFWPGSPPLTGIHRHKSWWQQHEWASLERLRGKVGRRQPPETCVTYLSTLS